MSSSSYYRCKTCMQYLPGGFCKNIHTKCQETDQTIKEMLTVCVPQLDESLSDEDFICAICLNKLYGCFEFITLCLESDAKMKSEGKVEECSEVDPELVDTECTDYWNDNSVDEHISEDTSDIAQEDEEYEEPDETSNTGPDHDHDYSQIKVEPDIPRFLSDTERIPCSDRIVVAKQPDGVIIPEFLRDLSNVGVTILHTKSFGDSNTNDDPILHLDSDEYKNKRILLIGNRPPKKKPEAITCSECSQMFKSSYRYTEHYKRNHATVCFVCEKESSSDKENRAHIKAEHPEYLLPFICGKCGAGFPKSSHFKKHQDTYKDFPKCGFVCEKCDHVFYTMKALETHQQGWCVFACDRCRLQFVSKEDRDQHIKENEGEPVCKPFTCAYCSERFTEKDYNIHMKVHPSIMCERCGKCFSSMASLKSHKVVHNDTNTVICHECGQGFKCQNSLAAHVNVVHKRKAPKLMCDQCPKKFYSLSRLKMHQKYHYNIRDVLCPKCDKSFYDKYALNEHDRVVHLKLQPYCCEECGRAFARKDYLKSHTRVHHGNVDSRQPYQCDKCGTRFSRRDYLLRHVETVHNQEGEEGEEQDIKPNIKNKTTYKFFPRIRDPGLPSRCHYCSRILKNLTHLKIHVQKFHIRRRRFKCNFCDLTFILKLARDRHEKVHSDPTYKFRCEICFKRSTSEEEFILHKARHINKPYKCGYCPETFARRYLMENHELMEHYGDEEEIENREHQIMEEALRNVEFIENMEFS